MNYKETCEYLFNSAPLFQNVGQNAYKEGLYNTEALDEHFGHPHRSFKTIHVAGTNGKGSCSHTLAAILQSAGYKVGLYTSPHLVDFRERIRVNGEMITEQYVVDFVEQHREFFEPLHPSFFELATAMAFKYFKESQVDIAVIEVGLGGRLDCTNIITPEVSIITNISFDHIALLGDTLAKIAGEKAGIIKDGIPVVIGENHPETRPVFEAAAIKHNAEIHFAEDESQFSECWFNNNSTITYFTEKYGEVIGELSGECQTKNANTIMNAVSILQDRGINITTENVRDGFRNVCQLTGLMGRWQRLQTDPVVICDTGHNLGGFEYIAHQLRRAIDTRRAKEAQVRIVFGMVNDKDISGVLALLPIDAQYYFCQASVKRALPYDEIKAKAATFGLQGGAYPTVAEAFEAAKGESAKNDMIYVGGSSFVVADLLSYLKK